MKQIYTGSCHCGFMKFEVDMDLDHVRVCDCSICKKRGALNHRVNESDMRIFAPLENMTQYKWHTQTATDYICPTCGILPFRHPRDRPDIWTVNVRCLDGIDLDTIPVRKIYGSKLD
ncbi:MAG: GFA family protein [Gammaproteobacteria bacterium]|nr:GFA family protein [Gammaproteobacteria bacterium]